MISMPDTWEYPWFAAWDLAFHCGALALIDVDFAKDQIELMLYERYLNPNGQIPAYEWNFSDVNPPVHALAALKAFRAERVQRGTRRITASCSASFTSCCSITPGGSTARTPTAHNVFEGGFLGLDNISVFDRSQPFPLGYRLKQADATGWMAMFALNMTVIALELTHDDPNYEDIAIQTYEQFLGNLQRARGLRDRSASAVGRAVRVFQGPHHRSGWLLSSHRRLFDGRPHSAVRDRGRGSETAQPRAALSRPASRSQGRRLPRSLCVRLPGLGERARRASALRRRSHHVAADAASGCWTTSSSSRPSAFAASARFHERHRIWGCCPGSARP